MRLRHHLLSARPADVIVFVGGDSERSEAEGLVMRAVGKALGAGVWAHAVVVDVGSGGREEGESAEGAEARQAALEQAVGAEARRGVPCVAWRAECRAAAEALGDAMAGVVCATAAAFFPPPLPAHTNADAPSALDFDDLAMLSDHNIATSAANGSRPLASPSAPPAAPKPTATAPRNLSPTVAPTPPSAPLLPAAPPSAPSPAYIPVPAFASLSLALSASALSSAGRPLLFPTSRPPFSLSSSAPLVRPAASPLARLTAVSAARPALSFQSKCLAPMPVVSACHVAAVNGLAADVSPAHAAVGPMKQATAFPDLMHLGRQAGNTCVAPSAHAAPLTPPCTPHSDPKGAAGAHRTVVQWVRNDLRLHDNEALAAAHNEAAAVLPVYCFDPRDYGSPSLSPPISPAFSSPSLSPWLTPLYGKSASGFDRTGPHRARFLLQCVAALRVALRERGSDLVLRVGRPEDVLPRLARAVGAQAVVLQQEVTAEESRVEAAVAARLKVGPRDGGMWEEVECGGKWGAGGKRNEGEGGIQIEWAWQEEGVEAQTYWGSTLFHVDDLPFALPHMPSNYSAFRQAVSRIQVCTTPQLPLLPLTHSFFLPPWFSCHMVTQTWIAVPVLNPVIVVGGAMGAVQVRDMVEAPEYLKPMPVMGNVQPGEIPSLEALGLSAIHPRTQNAHMTSMQGGEAEALRKLSGFVAESRSAATGSKAMGPSSSQYGASFSCKISPWLAMGCLSPRRVFHQVLQLEGSRAHQLASKPAAKARLSGPKAATATAAKEPSMDWLVFELLWRDFFRFITKRHSMGIPSVSSVPA
ncbi:unnamed protein product [Closterium sp. Naga37s-1]|nr:unnamed protein product [Closterium sp. Naga37s-1]